MKKNWFLVIAFVIVFAQSINLTMASSYSTSSSLGVAIKKYKVGNYTGCLQDMQNVVRRDPSNSVAYYYIAMSYAQAGRKDKAIEAYGKVLALRPNARLAGYAQIGKRCLETPEKCKEADNSSEIDKMVVSPYGDGLSSKVREDIHQKRLQMIKNEINTDQDIDNYKFKQFNDYTKKRSEAEVTDKLALGQKEEVQNVKKKEPIQQKQPTNDEIVAALRVLSQAGLNPYAQVPVVQNAMANGAYPQVNPNIVPAMQGAQQNDEMAQLSMMINAQSGNNNNNNSAMNMIPYMLSQSKNGNGNAYSPQLMQAMMMNSMLPNLDFNTNDDNK